MNDADPAKAPQGCPKCRSLLPDKSRNCPHCGTSVRGPKGRHRTAIACFLTVLALMAACGVKQATDLPPSGELATPAEEIVVKQHSTFWKLLKPMKKGEVTHKVEAGEVPVGLNASPMAGDALTDDLNDKMMASQMKIAAGGQGEVKNAVEAGQAYAVFIINESDKPARVKLGTTLRWGTPP